MMCDYKKDDGRHCLLDEDHGGSHVLTGLADHYVSPEGLVDKRRCLGCREVLPVTAYHWKNKRGLIDRPSQMDSRCSDCSNNRRRLDHIAKKVDA